MPHKRRPTFDVPGWVDTIRDRCLFAAVFEAYWARDFAQRIGADRGPCKALFVSADRTLESIQYGRLRGEPAWKKAHDALRKFTEAADCVVPPQERRRHLIRGAAA